MADKSNRKARSTQRLVNHFPEWADTRNDEQSDGFQFFNAIGATFDDLLKEAQTAQAGLHLATTAINRLDLGVSVQLPDDFIFQSKDNDPASEDYYPPVVSGLHQGTYYAVSLTEDNEIENWIAEPPSRISSDVSYLDYDYLVASGYMSDSPLAVLPSSGLIEIPSEMYVSVRSGEPYIYVDDSNRFHRGLVQVVGTSRYGYEATDELPFIHAEKQPTLNEFDTVSGIFAYGANNLDEAYITVQSMDFNSPPYPSAYYLDYDKWDKQIDEDGDIPTFWALGTNGVSKSTLDFVRYIHSDLDIRMAGFSSTYTEYAQELKDEDGNGIVARDLAVQPHSDHIWIVSHTHLYCYSTELPYMNLKSLSGRTAGRACRIETDFDYVLEGETITLEFIWRDPTQGLLKHRVSAVYEDGTKYVLDGDSLIAFDTADEYWNYGEPLTRHLRQPVTLTLTNAGRYTFTLEAVLGDQTTETDKRVIQSRPLLSPLAQFSFSDINITNNIVGIHIDRGNQIWVLTEEGHVFRILRHTDRMLIDYEQKVIYCKEIYDSLIVDEACYTEE